MDALVTVDLMVRGAAAGMCLILAAALAPLAVRSSTARFGALFALSAAAYGAASAPAMIEALPGLTAVLKVPAMLAGVFFWWFALALFCDAKRWHWLHLVPFVLVLSCTLLIPFGPPPALRSALYWGTELMNAALMIHVVVIILTGSKDDLVEPRRRFRAIWVGAIAGTILLITALHTLQFFTALPQEVHLAQAVLELLVSAGVTVCCISAQADFFPSDRAPARELGPVHAVGVAAADRHLAQQLRTAMADGVYAEPGLTVGALAERLGAPEHRLRAVINQQLGYRNFAAFLNEYRVSAAKSALADPAQARRQILQIALDLGYGSIAPFNRAFRAVVGMTPTEFRRGALEHAFDGSPAAAE